MPLEDSSSASADSENSLLSASSVSGESSGSSASSHSDTSDDSISSGSGDSEESESSGPSDSSDSEGSESSGSEPSESSGSEPSEFSGSGESESSGSGESQSSGSAGSESSEPSGSSGSGESSESSGSELSGSSEPSESSGSGESESSGSGESQSSGSAESGSSEPSGSSGSGESSESSGSGSSHGSSETSSEGSSSGSSESSGESSAGSSENSSDSSGSSGSSMSSGSSGERRVYKLGFYGAGSTTDAGNSWFNDIMAESGIPTDRRYVQNAGLDAVHDFLKWLDKNDNHVISESDVEGVTVKVCGYSWGGIAAIGFTQRLSQTGTIVVGGAGKNPISYRLDVPIAIEMLFTIDPVQILNQPGTVPSTVQNFYNYYQRRGDYAIFRFPDGSIYDDEFGSPFGNLLEGIEVDTAAQSSLQRMVDVIYPATLRTGRPFSPSNSRLHRE